MATALLSVSDKTGLIDFARVLADRGWKLLSSGGTAKALREANVPVTSVEEYTGSPEVMDGRVKTLHPRIHGGILSRGDVDRSDLARLGASEIDLVVVNLYPFEQVAGRKDATPEEIVENIDIGGPSMVRSAAKNHARVTVVVDPADYESVLGAIKTHSEVPLEMRRSLAAKAFAKTAAYDAAIAGVLSSKRFDASEDSAYARFLGLAFDRAYPLRYGENPHQTGAFYVERGLAGATLAGAESLGAGGKELSFNNLIDADAAMRLAYEFERPAAAVIKHTNPCGVSLGKNIEEAYALARDADKTSSFGGIVALNRPVEESVARTLAETFLECIVAPGFSDAALGVLRQKKNLRLLATQGTKVEPALDYKRVTGGLVVQTLDGPSGGEVQKGRVVTARVPSAEELRALEFAWAVCKHVKSNAIVLSQGETTVGVGAGQMSRVDSVRISIEKALERAKGAALASDAFFPFPDGVELAAKAGVTAIAQPGGSVKDAEVIAAANSLGLAMIFTGVRHFRH